MFIHAIALMSALLFQGAKLETTDTAVGTGREAKAKDVVTVEYTGKLTNGKEFDSSKGKQPYSFVLGAGDVIKGWDLGIAGMKVGGKRHLVIPAELAYGDRAMGDDIPAKSTLVFDVELLRIDREGDPKSLELKTTTPGKGEAAKLGDEILLNIKGCFINGKEFSNTFPANKPVKMVPGTWRQPAGITELLTGLKPGEKRHAVIPYTLGFGATGEGVMPPYATLVFDVEAVSIVKKTVAAERDKKMLKIEDEVVGTGAEAKDGDTVELHYTGMFPDGKKFDSSHDRNQTFTIKLGIGQVIRGFDLGILGMKVGGKRKVSIPAEMGYGARGAGGVIPPNQDLVFEIELISVK